MSNLFAPDTSTPSTADLTTELESVPGIGGLSGNVGVGSSAVTSSLPVAPSNSTPYNFQITNELNAAVVPGNTPTSTSGATNITLTGSSFQAIIVSKQNPSDKVIFTVTPQIDESRQANYEHLAPVHHPGTIQVYKNTDARTFNLTCKLISRTAAEATSNLAYINLIRSWVMPYYGTGTASSQAAKLGAPPDTLLFSVYGTKNIDKLPVILLSYHWVYPDNCDYIPTSDGFPFPTIMDISLNLVEGYSPEEYSSFDITKYKSGDMVGAFTFSGSPSNSSAGTTATSSGASAASTPYSSPQGFSSPSSSPATI